MIMACSGDWRYDCGMFTIKYMQHWNGATLAFNRGEHFQALAKAQSAKEPSGLNPTLEKSKPPSAPSVKGSGFTNLDNVVADSIGAKFNEPGEDEIYKKDQGSLDVKQANCHGSHNSTADKPNSEKTSPKAIGNFIPFAVSIISNANGTLEKIEPVKLPNGPGDENLQIGSIHKGSADGDSLIEKADDGGEKTREDILFKDLKRRTGKTKFREGNMQARGVETTRHFMLEWLSYTYRYVPVGLLDVIPQQLNWRPPSYFGRDDLETLMASDSAADWVPPGFSFAPKHKSNAYDRAENGWQHGIQEGAADWDEDWDKFEEEGMLLYSLMDNHNLVSLLVDKEKASTVETPTAASSSVDVNSENPPSMGERVVENGSAYSQTEDYSARSPGNSPLARVEMERSPAGSPAARTAMERSPVGSPAARAAFERSPDGNPAARIAFERSPDGSPTARHAFDSPSGELLDSHFFKPFSEDASPHATDTKRFDSFKSHDSGYFQPQETLARFDSKRRHTDYDHGHGFPSSDNSDPLALGPLRHHWTVKLQDEALIIGVPFSSVTLTLVMPEDSTLLVCFVSSAI
ncbi:tRNA-dihydrouridine(47) synthase [NAD(P)(+)]-like [Vitis vinifera]|uniref:tRNA-dihydrouridine(47) synthase [NAD(P)(+)]-like n=1 Tax=Vitis vinifera TaxID=29760 RepID=A0A438CQ92_VITVI|nr:tRNA-dihydrouridine(47) synthase [NAD(P)(+)]-like [Vitis vinifera]